MPEQGDGPGPSRPVINHAVPPVDFPFEAITVEPTLLSDKKPVTGDDDQPQALTIRLDCRDLNDVPTLLGVGGYTGDDTDQSTTAVQDADDDDVTHDDIFRHFWSRDGNLRYWVMVGGTRLHVTAEQLDDPVYGA
ncbi:hypothetical protein QFC19_006301 [Naganishia cerealis]|uniref:Uncharacterized protein n=1 Tax=Naganishia cerealis TaxID=610337 RepID=A0ACC2VHC1_9TREE|nr:hypothetical protein QFC19_006301 [Naganishia cerealis]